MRSTVGAHRLLASPRARRALVRAASKPPKPGDGRSVGDELLDFALAGKKMRKWYGAEEGELMGLPTDGGGGLGDTTSRKDWLPPPTIAGVRDALVVAGADGPVGEATVVGLIVAAGGGGGGGGGGGNDPPSILAPLVSDPAAASVAYGDYVTPLPAADSSAVAAALARAQTVVVAGAPTETAARAAAAGARHLIVLIADAPPNPAAAALARLLLGDAAASSEEAAAAAPGRGAAVAAAVKTSKTTGATLIRVRGLRAAPGGSSVITIAPAAIGTRPVAAGDAAAALVAAAVAATPPPPGAVVTITIADGGDGVPPADWGAAVRAAAV